MFADRSQIPSRVTTILVVIAAHALVAWLVWRLEKLPLLDEIEAFTSTLIWMPAADQAKQSRRIPITRRSVMRGGRATEPAAKIVQGPSLILLSQPSDANSSITLPSKSDANVDWSEQLNDVANSVLAPARLNAKRPGAMTGRYTVQDDPRNVHAGPSGFRWYDAGIHRIDTRSLVPVLHVNDHCALIAFIMPVCLIGHIEIHGDLFENMAGEGENNEATARPNDAP